MRERFRAQLLSEKLTTYLMRVCPPSLRVGYGCTSGLGRLKRILPLRSHDAADSLLEGDGFGLVWGFSLRSGGRPAGKASSALAPSDEVRRVMPLLGPCLSLPTLCTLRSR